MRLLLAACGVVSAQPRAFDVAAIKRSAPDVRISEFQMRPGGRLVVLEMMLGDLIRRANGLAGIERNDQASPCSPCCEGGLRTASTSSLAPRSVRLMFTPSPPESGF